MLHRSTVSPEDLLKVVVIPVPPEGEGKEREAGKTHKLVLVVIHMTSVTSSQ